jgi:N-acetylmuramoyl-L-alanine amidase
MNQGVRRLGVMRSAVVGCSIVASLGAVPAVVGAAVTHGARRPIGVARKLTLALSVDIVKPKSPVVITASVTPVEPGRTVLLRLSTGKRFRNIASATTNRSGVAIFHRTFGTTGTLRLRAQVVAMGLEPAVLGPVVREQVVSVLPFILPGTTQLKPGDQGPLVVDLQRRLSSLGYWLGGQGGYFGDATEQAVYALEKAAGIPRTGIVGPQFATALNADTVPTPKTTSGNAIDVDLERNLVEIVQNGKLVYTLNTSTGGGYTYVQSGVTNVATTPRGSYSTGRVVDGTVVDTLGTLWRPRFFVAGFAIHGDSYVPSVPVSHGCVRVSNEAIDWIWANNLDPIGETVYLY